MTKINKHKHLVSLKKNYKLISKKKFYNYTSRTCLLVNEKLHFYIYYAITALLP